MAPKVENSATKKSVSFEATARMKFVGFGRARSDLH
jgi:hypothetical protein